MQIGNHNQAFAILQPNYLKDGQWRDYRKARQNHYDCFFNPEVCDVSEEESLQWEECGSYPGIKMLIKRPSHIVWKYTTEGLKDVGP